MILGQAIQRNADDHNVDGGMTSNAYEADGHRKSIAQHWNGKGKSPLSKDQNRAGFEQFRGPTLAAKDLLCGGELTANWTSLLQTLANVHKVCFTSPRYEKSGGSHALTYLDCAVRNYDRLHPDELCRRVIATLGDASFAAGLACLA